MRTLNPVRDLTPVARERARYAAQIRRKASTVAVFRRTGNGVTGPKAVAQVASFVARVDVQRPHLLRQNPITNNDGWELTPIGFILLTLAGNDDPDGVSGNDVDIEQDDEIEADGQRFVVTSISRGRAKWDIGLIAKS